jgi:hypothetical protein
MAKLTCTNARHALIEGDLSITSSPGRFCLGLARIEQDGTNISYHLHLNWDEALRLCSYVHTAVRKREEVR